MKTKCFILFILLVAVITITSCKKKEESQPTVATPVAATPLSLSLSAEKTTISVGGDTKITASATGGSGTINYKWSVNTGSTLNGSGTQVNLYASCPSCTGPNKVTCTITDANNNTLSKDITISVQ